VNRTALVVECLFDMGAGEWVLNQEIPRGEIPVRPMGRIPVIARLVTAAGVELRPATAIRWTAGHVMVCVEDHSGPRVTADYVWLRATDVMRLLRTG
jgi:hypothetical protein